MDSYPTMDMIGNYFTKAFQIFQFRCFRNIVIGIHEDDIHSYNVSRRGLVEERKIKPYREKEEA